MAEPKRWAGEAVIDRLAHNWKVTLRLRDPEGRMLPVGEPFHHPSYEAARSHVGQILADPRVAHCDLLVVDNAAGGAQ